MNTDPSTDIDLSTEKMSSIKISEAEEQIAQLKAMVDTLTQRLDRQLSPDAPRTRTTKSILPKPQVFDGNKELFPSWRRFMQSKVERDVADIDRDRVEYVSAFTTGDPAIHVHNFLSLKDNAYCTYIDVLNHMEKRYGDPHMKEKAMYKLNRLAMKSQDFEDFITEFESLGGKAGIDRWPDEARTEILEKKLSSELRQLLVPVLASTENLKASYHTFVDTVRRVNNNFVAAKEDGAYKFGLTGSIRATQQVHQTKTHPASLPRQVAVASQDPDAMDWTHSYRTDTRPFANVISEKEYNARRNKGACTTCGNMGHFSRKCGYRIAKDQPRFNNGSRSFVNATNLPRQIMLTSEEEGKVQP